MEHSLKLHVYFLLVFCLLKYSKYLKNYLNHHQELDKHLLNQWGHVYYKMVSRSNWLTHNMKNWVLESRCLHLAPPPSFPFCLFSKTLGWTAYRLLLAEWLAIRECWTSIRWHQVTSITRGECDDGGAWQLLFRFLWELYSVLSLHVWEVNAITNRGQQDTIFFFRGILWFMILHILHNTFKIHVD